MSENKMTIEEFIGELATWDHRRIKELNSLNIINMYNATYVGKTEAKIRRDNLFIYLKMMKELKPSRLFVGEAPGIKGCYLTGIPFISEAIISGTKKSGIFSKNFGNGSKILEYGFKTISGEKQKKQTERTSTLVWKSFDDLVYNKKPELPLFWNIFPFHPGECTKSIIKNRPPTPVECKVGIEFLVKLLVLECSERIKEIYPVGKKAKETLDEVKDQSIKAKLQECNIPHPSYRGAQDFKKKLCCIYEI